MARGTALPGARTPETCLAHPAPVCGRLRGFGRTGARRSVARSHRIVGIAVVSPEAVSPSAGNFVWLSVTVGASSALPDRARNSSTLPPAAVPWRGAATVCVKPDPDNTDFRIIDEDGGREDVCGISRNHQARRHLQRSRRDHDRPGDGVPSGEPVRSGPRLALRIGIASGRTGHFPAPEPPTRPDLARLRSFHFGNGAVQWFEAGPKIRDPTVWLSVDAILGEAFNGRYQPPEFVSASMGDVLCRIGTALGNCGTRGR